MKRGSKSDEETGDMAALYDYDKDKKDVQERHSMFDKLIQENVLTDKSEAAKAGRRRVLIKATIGEFMCTLFFFTPIFCVLANGTSILLLPS